MNVQQVDVVVFVNTLYAAIVVMRNQKFDSLTTDRVKIILPEEKSEDL